MEVEKNHPLVDEPEFLQGMMELVISTRPNGDWKDEKEKKWWMIILREKEVTCVEMFRGVMQAYLDPYVPQTGIEFKHIWKYIAKNRPDPDFVEPPYWKNFD